MAVRKLDNSNTPSVWVTSPLWLNKASSGDEALYYLDLVVNEKVMKYFEDETRLPRYPVAVLPPHIDVRVAAQKSVYAIFGKNR